MYLGTWQRWLCWLGQVSTVDSSRLAQARDLMGAALEQARSRLDLSKKETGEDGKEEEQQERQQRRQSEAEWRVRGGQRGQKVRS